MLSFLILLCALIGVQGKAFPSRHKRNYEGSYHYIPYEESIVQIPAGYSPENLPNYQDYMRGYVQTNEHDWSEYYQPVHPQPIQHEYSNIDGNHKMKTKHTWHFINQLHDPLTRYTDEMHQFEAVEAPNVIEALVKKDVTDGHGEYDTPIVVEALVRKSNIDHADIDVPVDAVTVQKHPINFGYDKNSLVTEPSDSYYLYEPIEEKPVKDVVFISSNKGDFPVVVDSLTKKDEPVATYSEFELPVVVDSLTKKDKLVKEELADSYNMYEPIKEKPIKEKPIKEKPIKEKPIKEKPIKEKPIKEKPIKEKPIKEKPDSLNKEPEFETPVVIEALVRKDPPNFQMLQEHESPIVVEALVRKSLPVNEDGEIHAKPDDSLRPVEESILAEEEDYENFAIHRDEALTFEQNIKSNESLKREGIDFHETHGFNEAEMNSFDENGDHGSAMDFERFRVSGSFLPADSSIFSVLTNIQEQERRKFKKCLTSKNETGNCMPFHLCSVSSAVISIDELLRTVCVIDEVFIGVCCPEFPVETVRVDWEQLNSDVGKINEKSSVISKDCGKLPLRVTDRDPWPWMASLIAKSSDKIFCGGALVTDQYVLTAAHCTIRIPRNQILIRLGRPASANRPEPDFEVIEIKRHAGYNPRTMQNDIALLRLSRRVELGDFRRVVCLAKGEEDIEDLVGESASLLRWKETPGEIKDVEPLTVISTEECQSRMRTAIADTVLCTEPRTDEPMCNADSGAPLIIAKEDKFEVIGILTWNRNDCDERFPAVFTRVSSYHRWIEKLSS